MLVPVTVPLLAALQAVLLSRSLSLCLLQCQSLKGKRPSLRATPVPQRGMVLVALMLRHSSLCLPLPAPSLPALQQALLHWLASEPLLLLMRIPWRQMHLLPPPWRTACQVEPGQGRRRGGHQAPPGIEAMS